VTSEATTFRVPAGGTPREWRGRVGMLCLLCSEAAFFSVFVVTYLFYVGKSLNGPYPSEVLDLGLVSFNTVCLLSSSLTIGAAVRFLRRGQTGRFALWWFATALLGTEFLAGTAFEWRRLASEGLTPATNLFGTTFYSLVGFHAAHVGAGLILLFLVLALAARRSVGREQAERVEMLSWYWHFVDGVWIVILTVVYVLGR
jgi:cytochrome c oxidase subunit 3